MKKIKWFFAGQPLPRMCHIEAFLKSMLQRDFISLLPKRGFDDIAENILAYFDAVYLKAT